MIPAVLFCMVNLEGMDQFYKIYFFASVQRVAHLADEGSPEDLSVSLCVSGWTFYIPALIPPGIFSSLEGFLFSIWGGEKKKKKSDNRTRRTGEQSLNGY